MACRDDGRWRCPRHRLGRRWCLGSARSRDHRVALPPGDRSPLPRRSSPSLPGRSSSTRIRRPSHLPDRRMGPAGRRGRLDRGLPARQQRGWRRWHRREGAGLRPVKGGLGTASLVLPGGIVAVPWSSSIPSGVDPPLRPGSSTRRTVASTSLSCTTSRIRSWTRQARSGTRRSASWRRMPA